MIRSYGGDSTWSAWQGCEVTRRARIEDLPNSDAALQEEGTNMIDGSSAPAYNARVCKNSTKDIAGKKYSSLLQTKPCPQLGRNSTYRTVQTRPVLTNGHLGRWYRSIRLLNGRLSSSLDLDLLRRLLCRGLLRQRHRDCLDLLGVDACGQRVLLVSRQTAE
jgi:hypothetical protein